MRGQDSKRALAPSNIRDRLLLAGKLGLGSDALAVAATNVAQIGARRRYSLPRIAIKMSDSTRLPKSMRPPHSAPLLRGVRFQRGKNSELWTRGST